MCPAPSQSPSPPCLVREEQIVSKTSLFFPGRGYSPVPTPNPNLSHQAKVQLDRVEVTLLDFWPHGPPRAGITSQVHPSGCYGGGRGPRGDTPAAGSSPLWESSPLSEPSPSVGPPWAPASPQPLITPRHTVHLSSSWPERHLGAGRCLVHHQEVISGCTGDCWCPEQAEVFQVW